MKRKSRIGIALLWLLLLLSLLTTAAAGEGGSEPAGPNEGTVILDFDSAMWDDSQEMWVYTFNIPGGDKEYWLLEGDIPGYTSPDMVTPVNIGRGPYTITNTSTQENGSLSISKTVIIPEGVEDKGQKKEEFTFRVTLTGDSISGVQTFGDTVFSDGKATVRLKHGDIIVFSNIPAGTQYEVKEDPVTGYTAKKDCLSGRIEADKVASAGFINNVDIPPERPLVDIALRKQVTGAYTDAGEYDVFASFANLNPNDYYLYDVYEGQNEPQTLSFKAGEDGSASVSAKISPDRCIIFKGIPASKDNLTGATYIFTEQAGQFIASYEISNASQSGAIIRNAGANIEENRSLSTAAETAEEGEQITVTFINTINRTVSLDLVKKVNDGIDPGRKYPFVIRFADLMPNETIIRSSNGIQKADENGEIVFYRDLEADGILSFTGIPVNARYEVKEEAVEGYTPSYSIKDAEETKSKEGTTAGKPLSTGTLSVADGAKIEVTFSNTPVLVPISVTKRITGAAERKGSGYAFTLHVDSAEGVRVDAQEGGKRDAAITDEQGQLLRTITLDFYPVEDGYQADFELCSNETLTLGLTHNSICTVTEQKSAYYDTTLSVDDGEEAASSSTQCTMDRPHGLVFTNAIRGLGSLKMIKLTTGPVSGMETPAETTFTISGDNGYRKQVAFSDFVDGEYLLDGIPAGKYTVAEDMQSAQLPGYVLNVSGAHDVELAVNEEAVTQFVIHNTYSDYVPKTQVVIRKIWNDGSDPQRPTSITVLVTAKDDPTFRYTKVIRADDPSVVVDGNVWTFYAEWNVHDYLIDEIDVDGYVSDVNKNGNTFVITNTQMPPTGGGDSMKVWLLALAISVACGALLRVRKKKLCS